MTLEFDIGTTNLFQMTNDMLVLVREIMNSLT